LPQLTLEKAFRITSIAFIQKIAELSHTLAAAIERWRAGFEKTTGWKRVNPPNERYDFLDVFLVDEDAGFAVGRKGIVFKTADGGISWNQLVHNRTTEDLYGVYFVSRSVGYVVGNAGTILRTNDGGGTWNIQTNNLGSDVNYRDVFMLNSQKAILVGGTNHPRFGLDHTYTYLPGYIFLTNDGGLTWSAPAGTPPEVPWLNAVDMASNTTGTAVGGIGHFSPLGSYFQSTIIMRTEDGGQTWRLQENPLENQVNPHLDFAIEAVDFYDENVGIALTNANPPLYASDGETWLKSSRDDCLAIYQTGVSFLNANTAIHVGINRSAAGILKSTDAGQNWHTVDYGTYCSLQGVSFGSSNRGVAVGECSTVIRTDDSGETWQSANQFQPWIVTGFEDLMAVYFVDASLGYATGWSGSILQTTDGGATWQRARNIYNSLNTIFFHDFQNGFVGGSGLFRTSNGCATLEEFRTSDDGQTFSIQSAPTSRSFSPLIEGIDFGDPQTGVLVGRGVIYRTTNSGFTWRKVSPQFDIADLFLHDVQLVNSGTVIVVGTRGGWGGTVLRSTDAGITWQRMDLPIPYEWGPGDLHVMSLNGIHFPEGQNLIGYAVGNTDTVIKTNDGGNSWHNLELKIGSRRIVGHWNGVFFVDVSNGWIVGDCPEGGRSKGAILHTSDGGQTWTEQGTPSDTAEIFDGRRLQDVHFVTDRIGTVVGDGGLIVYTPTGGA
jgi:photosystem II stability/assembly factor-like uncharacterized protein